MENNCCGWFEIPVSDMERAMDFYGNLLKIEFTRHKLPNLDMSLFPFDRGVYGTGGALVCNPDFYLPSDRGTLLYLNSGTSDLIEDAATIEKLGGRVIIPRRQIAPEQGYMLIFMDTEGNRMALHSNK